MSLTRLARHSAVFDKIKSLRMPCISRVMPAPRLNPLSPIHFREPGISIGGSIDLCEVERSGDRQQLRIQLTATDDPQRTVARWLQGGRKVVKDNRANIVKIGVAGEHPVLPPRQRTAERDPGLAAHQHRLPEGELLEALQIIRQAPRQRTMMANHPVAAERGDQVYCCAQTATSALICGCA